MSWTHATRNLKHASSDTLAMLRDAAAVLIAHEHQISLRVMTDLLLIREETTAALQDLASSGIDWSWWTVILLKPDCLARELAESVLTAMSEHVTNLTQQTVHPTPEQISVHYDDILPLSAEFGVDVPAELRRIYLGQPVIVAIGYGSDAAARLRVVLGAADPGEADQCTDDQAVQMLIGHHAFRAHVTPIQLLNKATDPFLPGVRPHLFRVLHALDDRGLTNHVLIITRFKVTDADMNTLEALTNLRVTLLFTYSGITDSRVEPIAKSSITTRSIRTACAFKQRTGVVPSRAIRYSLSCQAAVSR